jgi:hypothetical protein
MKTYFYLSALTYALAFIVTGCASGAYKNCKGAPDESYCQKMYDNISAKQAMVLDTIKEFKKDQTEEGYALDTVCAEEKAPQASCVFNCAKDEQPHTWQECAQTCRDMQISHNFVEHYKRTRYSR